MSSAPHNILHIIADDLRPELGAYGLENRSTPNIDRLAAGGAVFDRAYAQQAVCGPSRNSFMTGRRPDASRSWNFINHFREDHPEWTSLPGLFVKAGRLALGSGKIYHPMLPPAYDGNLSWSPQALPFHNPCWNTADNPSASFQDGGLPCVPCAIDIAAHLPIIKKFVNVTVGDDYCTTDAYEDTLTVAEARKLLRIAAKAATPFYLAVGVHKPHTPWQAAQVDFDAHPLADVALPAHPHPPTNMPPIAFHFTDYALRPDPWTPAAPAATRAARRAYRAAVTGMDRKLGELLTELDVLHLENCTAVILHGDHGWHLGEGGEWRKMTNFEHATRVPLIIRAPWLSSSPSAAAAAVRVAALVELVDLYPTMAELAGLALPKGETLDGVSMVPLLRTRPPAITDGATSAWQSKPAAFSQYPRRVTHTSEAWNHNSIIHHERTTFTHMGYSARTPEWRFTEWVEWNQTSLKPVWGRVAARELYDHRNETTFPTDFDVGETENIASHPEVASEVEALAALVRQQFG